MKTLWICRILPLALLGAAVGLVSAQLQPCQPAKPFPGTGTERETEPPLTPAPDGADMEEVKGGVKWEFAKGSEHWYLVVRRRIERSMNEAVNLYNKYGKFRKRVTVNYSPGTPTAEGNIDGRITFGGQIGTRTALHEIAHTIGVGTHPRWGERMKDGKWTGKHAVALLKEFDGETAELKGDRQHFWPYGLNYENESSREANRRHVELVGALLKDMGGPP